MNRNLYSNNEFTELKKNINQEIQRRGTYKWWDPLTIPSVGEDRTSSLTLPDIGERFQIDENTYSINNPSEGSIEPTKNIKYPAQGENPAGQNPNNKENIPSTSAAQFNADEMRNLLVGLAKIQDINLFYGRDEVEYLAFRDPKGIEDVLNASQNSKLNVPLKDSDISPTKNDPNGGIIDRRNPDYPVDHSITYPIENGQYVMPSGEYDGEEALTHEGLGVNNFYDDYGAKPGDANYHPTNRYVSPVSRRDWNDQDHNRNDNTTKIIEGGIPSARFGPNPRNPQQGNQYRSRPVFGGKIGACNVACTGLCYMTCDNQCSESCSTTCWNRCGEACTASCGNVCTGCSTMCYSSCKTKCENSTGYSCLKAGAKAIKITTTGGKDGQPASNHIKIETHSCEGCSFSCQFYPNKKTECWDAGCMGKCFTSCTTSCSTSCYGGCIDNASEEKSNSKYPYKTGKGRGCSSGCTLNCIGLCSGVCEGYCVQTCFNACKGTCSDNCSFECSTNCGSGCDMGCTKGCTGCSLICTGECIGQSTSRTCVGCGSIGGCTSSCQFECDKNCMGFGCRSICGIDTAGACEANCRLNCTATSCTAMCSDACSQQCSTCVNTCGFQCGACTSSCSTGCGAACNITCTQSCSHSCETNCVHSCSEECGGCSNLCYSCIGMCIGVCSVKCEDGCSSCANNCGWWCDSSCSRECFGDCSSRCISTCSGSCATFLTSNTTMTEGPERDPIADGYIYPHPANRWEERESFKIIRNIPRFIRKTITKDIKLVTIAIEKTSKYVIFEMSDGSEITKDVQQIYDISKDSFITNKREVKKNDIINIWRYYKGRHVKVKPRRVYKYNYVYIWNTDILGEFNGNIENSYINRDSNIIVVSPKEIHYDIKQTSLHGGIFDIDPSNGNITINESMIPGIIESTQPSISTGGSIFIITLHQTDELQITNDDIDIKLPFGFEALKPIRDNDGNIIIIIRRDPFLFPEEEEKLHEQN